MMIKISTTVIRVEYAVLEERRDSFIAWHVICVFRYSSKSMVIDALKTSVDPIVQYVSKTFIHLEYRVIYLRVDTCFIGRALSSFFVAVIMPVPLANSRCLTWSNCGIIWTMKSLLLQCPKSMITSMLIFFAKIVIRYVCFVCLSLSHYHHYNYYYITLLLHICFAQLFYNHFYCLQESTVKFHVVGLKCQNKECGGYNTTRTQKRNTNNETTPSTSSEDTKDDNNDGACSSSTGGSRNVA